MRRKSRNNATETANRVQENISNLPITSMALAGVLGAGVMAALFLSLKPAINNNI